MPPKKKVEESESEETDIESYDESDNSSSNHEEDDEDDEDIDDDDNDENDENNEDEESKDKKNKEEPDEHDDDCVYRFAKPVLSDESDMDVSDGNISDDDDVNTMNEFVLPEDRITKPFISDTEKIRVVLERRTQITLGAKPMIKGLSNITSLQNPRDITFLELEHHVLPLKIIRTLPSGKKELWYLHEFKNLKKKI